MKGIAESQFESTTMNNQSESKEVWWLDNEVIKKHVHHLGLFMSLMLSVMAGVLIVMSCIKK